jgi:hypothetical protein
VLFNIGIHQGYVYAKGFACGSFALPDMMAQNIRVHAAAAYKPQAACIAYRAGQSPTARPYHACLDDGVLNAEKLCDAVGERFVAHFWLIFQSKSQSIYFLSNFKIKMLTITEEILRLPRDEKLEILHTLQENLQNDDDILENEKMPEEVMTEVKRRMAMIETGEAKWIDKEELIDFLKQRRH